MEKVVRIIVHEIVSEVQAIHDLAMPVMVQFQAPMVVQVHQNVMLVQEKEKKQQEREERKKKKKQEQKQEKQEKQGMINMKLIDMAIEY